MATDTVAEDLESARNAEFQLNAEAMLAAFPSFSPEDHGKVALMRHGEVLQVFSLPSDAMKEAKRRFPDRLYSIQPIIPMPIECLGDACISCEV